MDTTAAHWLAPVQNDDQGETTPSEANYGMKIMEFEKIVNSPGEGDEVGPNWNNHLL